VRIFVAAGIVGFCGLWALRGFDKAVGIAGHIPYSDTTNYALSVLPLFILIGHLAHHAGIVQGAYRCARAWLGWLPGGLGIATIFAAAGFAAVSGASTATAAVFARIAMPELLKATSTSPASRRSGRGRRGHPRVPDPAVGDHGRLRHHHRNLDRRAADGRLHPWRHLGAPLRLDHRRAVQDQSGARPGPCTASRGASGSSRCPDALPIVFVIGAVIGGMYTGWATPTEVGALGAFIVFVMALLKRTLTGRGCSIPCSRPRSSR
jgi:hypothetical protein